LFVARRRYDDGIPRQFAVHIRVLALANLSGFCLMTAHPTDLEIAALISSKICHDAINPVAAITHGLQMLDDEVDAEQQKFTLDMIRNVTAQASARIEFARIAFGSSGSSASPIDMSKAQDVATRYVSPQTPMTKNKHRLTWQVPAVVLEKDKGKLLLNLIATGIYALARGGEITAAMTGTAEKPMFAIRCKGTNAKPPQHLVDFIAGLEPDLDALNIQAYYVHRLARSAGMALTIVKDGADVVLVAKTI
jgi:histidine phosphotransferase ChpT